MELHTWTTTLEQTITEQNENLTTWSTSSKLLEERISSVTKKLRETESLLEEQKTSIPTDYKKIKAGLVKAQEK